MPYNTRRKSLSLPSLGIHVPVTHAARAAAAAATKPAHTSHSAHSPSNTSRGASPASAPSFSSSSSSAKTQPAHSSTSSVSSAASAAIMAAATSPKRSSSDSASAHPSKRSKRSHSSESIVHAATKTAAAASASSARKASHATPPPSPKPSRRASVETDAVPTDVKIDMRTVNDDIVEAVILELQSSGNRPHLIKELESILMRSLKSVQQSANPSAIICSRLASYMKRPCWSASNICPLTKELETTHPRRTYYYLTTCPHQPLPDASSVHFIVPRTSIVTPPLSSTASGSESAEERRRELSPSPEVDLSSPEFDDLDDDMPMPGTPSHAFSSRYARYVPRYYSHHVRYPRVSSNYLSRHQRGGSPPLEKDEKEFTQTAEGLQKRKKAGNRYMLSMDLASSQPGLPSTPSHAHGHNMDLEIAGRDDSSLFGSESRYLTVAAPFTLMTSPAMRPTFSLGPKRDTEADGWAKIDTLLDWDRSPENIELEELDGLLDDF